MRHKKHTFKVGRTGSHRRAMIANMLKSLIENGRISTTITKAKELRRHADRMITIAKKDTLASRRNAISKLHITFNPLTPKEARQVKGGDTKPLNRDRKVMKELFGPLKERYGSRNGGYTRIIRSENRVGDNAPTCFIEFVS